MPEQTRRENKRIIEMLSRLKQGEHPLSVAHDIDHGNDRGLQSELNALQALNELQIVRIVRKTPRFGGYDMRGIDLIVNLHHERARLSISSVNVQVKSSDPSIFQFIAEAQRRFITPPETTDQYFKRNRIVLINGQMEPDAIRDSFIMQTQEIAYFVQDQAKNL